MEEILNLTPENTTFTQDKIDALYKQLEAYYLNKYLELLPEKKDAPKSPAPSEKYPLGNPKNILGQRLIGKNAGWNEAIDELTKRLKEGQDD